MTDIKETRINQQTPRSRARRPGLVRLGLLGLVMIFILGCQRCDDQRPPSLSCQSASILVEPGTCTPFQNPCVDGQWLGRPNFDGFELCPTTDEQRALIAAAQVSLLTTRIDGQTSRWICVGAGAPLVKPFAIPFRYGRGLNYGTASIILTVARPLTVEVTARPSSIAVGEQSQLLAIPRDGIPNYFYTWVPNTGLNYTDIAAPIATPTRTTTYLVGVTDEGGQQTTGSVTVFVREQLRVTADPPQVRAGEPSQLLADVAGGTPPYTFLWTPEGTLNDPRRQDPTATPTITTTYSVIATDSVGATRSGSATVSVSLDVRPSATPSTIQQGQTSQLDAVVTGGIPPYSYSWVPADSLSDPRIRNPVASSASSQSYCVQVSDAIGGTIVQCVTVTVAGSPLPTASFVFNVVCCPTLNLDASASTGNIVSYTWDLSWTAANPDRVTSSPTTSFTIRETDRGTITLTVTDTAGRTATVTRSFP